MDDAEPVLGDWLARNRAKVLAATALTVALFTLQVGIALALGPFTLPFRGSRRRPGHPRSLANSLRDCRAHWPAAGLYVWCTHSHGRSATDQRRALLHQAWPS